MTVASLLLATFLVFVVVCVVIGARRGLWLKVEVTQPTEPRRTRMVVHRHLHYHEVAHRHYVEVAHRHELAHHHYLRPEALGADRPAARVGFLARAVLPRTPGQPPVDDRLIQHVYDPKETQ